jgi:hypothetical protein
MRPKLTLSNLRQLLFPVCFAAALLPAFNSPGVAKSKVDRPTELIRAVRDGQSKRADKLLQKNADINTPDNYGWTPLMYAVFRSDGVLVEKLISHGADINAQDQDGVTPLIAAIMFTPQPFMVPFLSASQKQAVGIAPFLIEKGADPNRADKEGHTPLIYAVIGSQEQIINALVRKGANPNQADSLGRTPLFFMENPEYARAWSPAGGVLSSRYRVRRGQSDESGFPPDYVAKVAAARADANVMLAQIKTRITDLLRKAGAIAPDPRKIASAENSLTDTAPERLDLGRNDPIAPLLGNYMRASHEDARYHMLVCVDANGKVQRAFVLFGIPGFSEAIQKTAYKLKYRPALKDGRPVETWDSVIGFVGMRMQIFR